MAGASVARAGALSSGGASIDEMIMQRPEKAAPATCRQICYVASAGSLGGLVRALPLGAPAPVQLSIVEIGGVLSRLEDLWIVAIENLRVIGIAHLSNTLIAAIGVARILRTRDRRDEVLVKIFLEINHIPCEDYRAGLGEL